MTTRREFLQATVAGIGAAATARVGHCDDAALTGSTLRSGQAGSAVKSIARIRSVVRREETILRYSGSGDNWHMSWAADDRQYVSLCDGAGFSNPPNKWHNSRMLAIFGGPKDAMFQDLSGYPTLAQPAQGKDDARYYSFGTLALDTYLYQFLSTFNRPFRYDKELDRPNLSNVLRFNGAKLIYSPDRGRTWHNQNGSTPVIWEPWDRRSRQTMLFFDEDQEAFSLLSVLQMGKNYEHNHDGYIYIYAPNGNTDGTMNELVMLRTHRSRLLDRSSYEYFAGRRANGAVDWTKDIDARAVVHTFPRGWVNQLLHPYSWQPSVVYNAPLGLYLMANWGMGNAPDGLWFGRPSYLGFWVAPVPWGPWTQIHEEVAWLPGGDAGARAYQPQIAPKWIAADGKSFWLVWTDFQVTDEQLSKQAGDEDKRQSNETHYSEAELVRSTNMMRKYMPYYTFNVQQVDLVMP